MKQNATGPLPRSNVLSFSYFNFSINNLRSQLRAGVAVGNFTVSVVKPVPPDSPKERKVEERFTHQYFVVIGVSATILSILTITIAMLLIVRCRRVFRRRSSSSATSPHLYQCSVSDTSFASDRVLVPGHNSKMNCLLDTGSEGLGYKEK